MSKKKDNNKSSLSLAQLKKTLAIAAIESIGNNRIIGVGTGSTVNCFIDELAKVKNTIDATVASSKATEDRLKSWGIVVEDLNNIDSIPLYIDSADEFTVSRYLIKGGGGALTREKIVSANSDTFICIVDSSKKVDTLGTFPLPIEVLPIARSYVAREIVKLGGHPNYRQGFITDNGHLILDVYGLSILDPIALEERINHISGVVCNGLFAKRPADKILVATSNGVHAI